MLFNITKSTINHFRGITNSYAHNNNLLMTSRYNYMRPKKNIKSQSHPFKLQQQKIQRHAQQQKKKYGYLQIGLYGLVFACCFAGIPLYRVFCEKVGLIGNYDKKTYEFNDKKSKIANLKKYIVKFQGQPQPGINWQFQPVQKQVQVASSQTAIVFYRLYNKQDTPIVGFSTYNITPEQVNIYFSKIQCFCFNQQMINPGEQLLLPLFFYLQPQLAEDPDIGRIRECKVHYDFIRSSNQDLAKFAQEELRRVEENKKKLREIRAKKKNMTLEEYEQEIYEQEVLQQKKIHEEMDSNNQSTDNSSTTHNSDGSLNVDNLQPVPIERINHNENNSNKHQRQSEQTQSKSPLIKIENSSISASQAVA